MDCVRGCGGDGELVCDDDGRVGRSKKEGEVEGLGGIVFGRQETTTCARLFIDVRIHAR